ncbi:MAG TPA: Maf family protein [Rhizomicrobium sp.]|nr:Maf family protein [Rhizomicrobium sp.]
MNLVLASASASRRRVLAAAGVPYVAMPADVDEDALKAELLTAGVDPAAVAPALAEAKAVAVSRRNAGTLVLGGDQTLLLDRELIGKCTGLAEARALLRRLRGRAHRLVSALALARDGAVIWRHVESPTLAMRDFSDAFLDRYLAAEGEGVLSGVGCYKLEGPGAQLFERVEGDYFAVLGLPLLPLLAELRRHGVIAT